MKTHLMGYSAVCFLSSCVVIPYATPPARVSAALGYAGGEIEKPSATGPRQMDQAMVGEVRVGLHPLQLFLDREQRFFDVGAGYTLQALDGTRAPKQGGYIETALFPWHQALWQGHLRLGLHGSGDVLLADVGRGLEFGGGGAVTVGFEWVQQMKISGDEKSELELDNAIVSWGYGESGLGLFASSSYHRIAQRGYWTVTGGISIRMPAMAGLLLVTQF